MATIEVTPLGDGRTEVTHPGSGAFFTTDSSLEWGGQGRSFSATDLVAAGLGACIGSSVAVPLERRGIPLDQVLIEVKKTLGEEPRKIEALKVVIHVPVAEDADLERVLLRVAGLCPVSRSLDCDEKIIISFEG